MCFDLSSSRSRNIFVFVLWVCCYFLLWVFVVIFLGICLKRRCDIFCMFVVLIVFRAFVRFFSSVLRILSFLGAVFFCVGVCVIVWLKIFRMCIKYMSISFVFWIGVLCVWMWCRVLRVRTRYLLFLIFWNCVFMFLYMYFMCENFVLWYYYI